jgi:hypothetical protein
MISAFSKAREGPLPETSVLYGVKSPAFLLLDRNCHMLREAFCSVFLYREEICIEQYIGENKRAYGYLGNWTRGELS